MIGLETSSYTTLFVKIKGRRQIYEHGFLSLSASLGIVFVLHVLAALCTSIYYSQLALTLLQSVQCRSGGHGGHGGQEVRELFFKQLFLLNERSVVLCLGT